MNKHTIYLNANDCSIDNLLKILMPYTYGKYVMIENYNGISCDGDCENVNKFNFKIDLFDLDDKLVKYICEALKLIFNNELILCEFNYLSTFEII